MIVTFTFFALSANFREETDSSSVPWSDVQLTIKDVINLLVKEYLSNRVSLESLKGIWSVFFLVTKALMTFPKQDREKFIFFVSSKAYPLTPALLTFSLPAKSIKQSFDCPSAVRMLRVRKVWLRELFSLRRVEAVRLLFSAVLMYWNAWATDYIFKEVNPSATTPLPFSFNLS